MAGRELYKAYGRWGYNTFISRYRKEMTGSLDEVTISSIKDENNRLKELDARIESVKIN